MKRIALNMKDQKTCDIIKDLVDHNGNKMRAALKLGCSLRTVYRHIAGYKEEGKAYFVHGNHGRKPAHALDEGVKGKIPDLYREKYYGANFSHFTELLEEREGIKVSETLVRGIMAEAETLSPKATRKTRRKMKSILKERLKAATSEKEEERIKARIVDADDAHPRRPRCANFGEMIQMDASEQYWIDGRKWTLHLAVDDATGLIVGAWFAEQETLQGYYNVLRQILTGYGIPYMFYTDRRTVFEYRRSGSGDTADDSFTQFSYACRQLGVQIKTTSVPQAKGRVERKNGTAQSRLPVELRLEGVTTIEQANDHLPGLIAKLNKGFALDPDSIPSVFETQPSLEKIDRILAVVTERTVDAGHSVRFENKFYSTLNRNGSPVYISRGVKGLVIRTFSGELFFSADDHLYAMLEIPDHERNSRNFGFAPPPDPKPVKKHIPAMNHPWRVAAFQAFLKKQARDSA